jgi:hypothetical protein
MQGYRSCHGREAMGLLHVMATGWPEWVGGVLEGSKHVVLKGNTVFLLYVCF